ncbi:MAG TPA: hypothetical protein VIU45_07590 [Chitinophagaceae bacterium]
MRGLSESPLTPPVQKKENNLSLGSPRFVVQRNKHLKRFLNVITLGGRKIYVKHKRAQALAAQNNPGNVQIIPREEAPEESDIDKFVTAYEKARYYHKTDPHNLKSIEKHGLMNYEDRVKILGEDVGGMSRLGGEFKGDEKKGVFLGPKGFMQANNMTSSVARAYLGAERTKLHHWDKTDVPPDELVRDEKFRGGAVITKNSIPSTQVTTKSISELEESDDPKLGAILETVASQYKGPAPDQPGMKALLKQAIRERRLSNAPFDA